jgi:hypothetical protein
MARKSETQEQILVANYLAEKYPNVQFHSDYGSGARLRPHQAKEQSELNAGRKSWPDLFIAEPVIRMGAPSYNGLFIEMKRTGTKIFTRKGTLVSDEHIREQFDLLEQLRRRGYCAEFACGYEEATKIIDDYLGGEHGDR